MLRTRSTLPAHATSRPHLRPGGLRAAGSAALLGAALVLGTGVSPATAAVPPLAASADRPYVAGVLAGAASLAGTPYRWGGTTPAGFDCSGFIQYVFRANGVELPRTSQAMRDATPVLAPADVQAGDLVFVHSSSGRVTHAGIVNDDGRWWEATRPGRPLSLNEGWSARTSYGRV